MKIANWTLAILLISPLSSAAARPQGTSSPGQQDSLADAARRTQAQKKDQQKSGKVWDNDSIPNVTGTVNVVGSERSESAAPAAGEQKAPAPKTAEEKAALTNEMSSAKAELDSLKADLDIAQRKYSLDQSSYISNPDHSKDKAGAASLKDEKDQLDAKQQEIAAAQKKLEDLQAEINAAK